MYKRQYLHDIGRAEYVAVTDDEAVAMIDPRNLDTLLHPQFDTDALKKATPVSYTHLHAFLWQRAIRNQKFLKRRQISNRQSLPQKLKKKLKSERQRVKQKPVSYTHLGKVSFTFGR